MAAGVGINGGIPELALDDHEFSVTRKGYDREEVGAYLAEIEANVRQFEEWAQQMKARLALAEEKNAAIADVDEAMVAVFKAKDRVLQRAQLRAERIEAEATERARADAGVLAADMIGEAREEARHIAEATLAATAPATEGSILAAARTQADRVIQDARNEAERLIEDARGEAGTLRTVEPTGPSTLPDPEIPDQSIGSASVAQLLVDMEGVRVELEGSPGDELRAGDDDGEPWFASDDDGGAARQSRYERTSARLPSIGDDASAVLASIQRLRKMFRDS